MHLPDRKPIEDAVIRQAAADMAASGMPEMSGKVTALNPITPRSIAFWWRPACRANGSSSSGGSERGEGSHPRRHSVR